MRAHGLAVEEEGPQDAPVVVLVHGSMDRMAGFAKVVRRLCGEYRTVRYDRRGYGRSVHHRGPFTIADHVDDLVQVIGDREVVVVGHSMGGNVVLAAAQRLGSQVRAVAVYETPLAWTPQWASGSTTATVAASGDDPADVAEGFLRRMIGDDRWERLPASSRAARRAEGPALVGEMRTVRERAPWAAEAIAVPVIVGVGSEARPHHREGMPRLAASIAGARLVVLEGCGHLAHVARPDQFTDELIRPSLRAAGWW